MVLLAIWRPAPMEAGREGLVLAIAFGVALAAMNFFFYEALDRIPLGIAVTFEFVGPLLVGLLGSRRPLDLVWVGCAAAGVLLLTRPSGSASAAGIGFALLAGGFWGRLHPAQCQDRSGVSRRARDWRWRWGSLPS